MINKFCIYMYTYVYIDIKMFLPSLLLKLALLAFHLTLKFDILLITSARRIGQGAGLSKPYTNQPGIPRNERRPATHLLRGAAACGEREREHKQDMLRVSWNTVDVGFAATWVVTSIKRNLQWNHQRLSWTYTSTLLNWQIFRQKNTNTSNTCTCIKSNESTSKSLYVQKQSKDFTRIYTSTTIPRSSVPSPAHRFCCAQQASTFGFLPASPGWVARNVGADSDL